MISSAPISESQRSASACAGVSTVFHVAAKVGVWGRHEDFFRANVLGTRAVIAGCRRHGVRRLVHTSTPSVVYNGRDLAGWRVKESNLRSAWSVEAGALVNRPPPHAPGTPAEAATALPTGNVAYSSGARTMSPEFAPDSCSAALLGPL